MIIEIDEKLQLTKIELQLYMTEKLNKFKVPMLDNVMVVFNIYIYINTICSLRHYNYIFSIFYYNNIIKYLSIFIYFFL